MGRAGGVLQGPPLGGPDIRDRHRERGFRRQRARCGGRISPGQALPGDRSRGADRLGSGSGARRANSNVRHRHRPVGGVRTGAPGGVRRPPPHYLYGGGCAIDRSRHADRNRGGRDRAGAPGGPTEARPTLRLALPQLALLPLDRSRRLGRQIERQPTDARQPEQRLSQLLYHDRGKFDWCSRHGPHRANRPYHNQLTLYVVE